MQVHLSFLEIYNEAGYDLLAPSLAAQVVEDLPRVHIMEDNGGKLHMRNLSLHPVVSEEEALNLVGSSHITCMYSPLAFAHAEGPPVEQWHMSGA